MEIRLKGKTRVSCFEHVYVVFVGDLQKLSDILIRLQRN